MSVVVSDTSPIRGLVHLGRMDLLEVLFGPILVPPAVAGELGRVTTQFSALDLGSIDFLMVRAPSDQERVTELRRRLDPGEAEAIVLALEIRAEWILMDEARGRAVAARLGLVPLGLVGILIRAKGLGLISEIRPMIRSSREEAGFFLSTAFCEGVLRRAGE